MDTALFTELVRGPGGFLVGIAAFAWLAVREWRKGRAEDVVEAQGEAQAEKERRVRAEAEVETMRETNRVDREATLRKYHLAREKAISHGVPPEELP